MSRELIQGFGVERHISALERVQVTLAMLFGDPLEILLTTALLAFGSFPEILIGRLPVTCSSSHVLTPRL